MAGFNCSGKWEGDACLPPLLVKSGSALQVSTATTKYRRENGNRGHRRLAARFSRAMEKEKFKRLLETWSAVRLESRCIAVRCPSKIIYCKSDLHSKDAARLTLLQGAHVAVT